MTKAILLAAGRGERLRPLTDHTPKPLIEVGGKPLIVYHLEKLAAAGITDVVINISYLARQFPQTLGDGSQFGVHITYSFEPEALETGGGIYQALPLLGDRPFLAIAADLYTDYPCAALPAKLKGLAHLILVPNPDFNPKGDFSLDNQGYVSNVPTHTYASFGIFHPAFFELCQPGRFSITPYLRQAAENQQITGEIYHGLWHNVGSLQELQALKNTLRGPFYPPD